MLIVKCSGCQSKIKFKEQFAGKRIKCPKCQASVQVPAILEDLVPLELVPDPPATPQRDVNLSQREPQNLAPIVNQSAETFSAQPAFQVDFNRPATTPRRRQKMYNRAVLIFQNVGQTQLAQNYAAAAQQMKSQLPK